MPVLLIILLVAIPAWGFLVHLYWSLTGLLSYQIDTLAEVAVAIIGIIFPPFGVVHGWCVFTGLTAWGV